MPGRQGLGPKMAERIFESLQSFALRLQASGFLIPARLALRSPAGVATWQTCNGLQQSESAG